MLPVVQQDILNVLSQSKEILRQRNSFKLKELSNHTIHNASIFQDEDSVSVAVVIYALSKLLERTLVNTDQVIHLVEEAERALKAGRHDAYQKAMKRIFSFISRIDNKLKLYIDEVIMQAQVKKGSKLYDHGISMAQAAGILGISQWELMEYVGKTQMIDKYPERLNIRKRLRLAHELFNM